MVSHSNNTHKDYLVQFQIAWVEIPLFPYRIRMRATSIQYQMHCGGESTEDNNIANHILNIRQQTDANE